MASPLCVNTEYKEWVKVKHNYIIIIIICSYVVSFCFCFSLVFCDFCDFVILILTVVAYCTQLLSQAMYNLMMAAMAETCSC